MSERMKSAQNIYIYFAQLHFQLIYMQMCCELLVVCELGPLTLQYYFEVT